MKLFGNRRSRNEKPTLIAPKFGGDGEPLARHQGDGCFDEVGSRFAAAWEFGLTQTPINQPKVGYQLPIINLWLINDWP
jgi:hypothetical protein